MKFTNPVQSADIDRDENPNLKIKWKAPVRDTTATATLSATFDAGSTWRVISSTIKLNAQSFTWAIPDTTAFAQVL